LPQAYSTFEDVAYKFFSDCKQAFGFTAVKRNATLPGKSGNCYKVEVLGRRASDRSADVIIECKHYGADTDISQEIVGGLAYRVQHTDGSGAFIATTHELQCGATQVADFEHISVFIFDPSATLDDYGTVREIAQGLSRFFVTLKVETTNVLSVGKVVTRRDENGNVISTENRDAD
jgi:hypothetical protein